MHPDWTAIKKEKNETRSRNIGITVEFAKNKVRSTSSSCFHVDPRGVHVCYKLKGSDCTSTRMTCCDCDCNNYIVICIT